LNDAEAARPFSTDHIPADGGGFHSRLEAFHRPGYTPSRSTQFPDNGNTGMPTIQGQSVVRHIKGSPSRFSIRLNSRSSARCPTGGRARYLAPESQVATIWAAARKRIQLTALRHALDIPVFRSTRMRQRLRRLRRRLRMKALMSTFYKATTRRRAQ